MDMSFLHTLADLEKALAAILNKIHERRALQRQLAHDPGLLAWQAIIIDQELGPLDELPPLEPALSWVMPQDRCDDCWVEEGMLHSEGCAREICPLCTKPHARCECLFTSGALGQPRVPFFAEPRACCYRCMAINPALFLVSNAVWQAYVPPHWRAKLLCLSCFVYIIRVIDQAATLQPAVVERLTEGCRSEEDA